jgi:carboxyl-terminal processing protease
MRGSIALLSLLIAAPLGAQRKEVDTTGLEQELRRFMEIYAIVEQSNADSVAADQAFYQGAIPGMLRKLDPHSVFFDRDQFEQLRQMEKAVSKGFGSVVSVMPGRVIVLQTLPGTPSQKAGLAPGDEIIGINNIPLARLDMDQLVGLMQQARMNQVLLFVRRQGTAGTLNFTMVPEEMQAASVDRAFFLEDGVGYLRITSFDAKTGHQAKDAIEKLGGSSMKGLVIDLRDNPGGVLESALETAALFLKPGTKLLSARGRNVAGKDIDVPKEAQPYEFPLAVLVNGRSASGSEIVAGALQDHDRAAILGEPTFGKGLVQSVFPLKEDTGIALTTAFYYTPSGRSIQKPLRGGQLDEATEVKERPEYKTDKGRVVKGGGGIDPDEIVQSPRVSRLIEVIELTASFSAFATDYVRPRRSSISRDFEVAPDVLDDFQLFLSSRNIRPGISEWTFDREYIKSRLKQEILNQSVGVAVGDEIEMRRDPVVRRALETLQKPG